MSHRLTDTSGKVGDLSPNWLNSSRPPTTKLMIEPTPRMPNPLTWVSSITKTTASKTNTTPAQLTGRLPAARNASSRQIAPTTPGAMRPGLNNSMTRPRLPRVSRIKETLGSDMTSKNNSSRFLPNRLGSTSRVSRILDPLEVSTSNPSTWASSPLRSSATKSTILNSTASLALNEAASLTVSSSFSSLRPRSWAMLRISAAAAFSILLARVSSKSRPVEETGVAAPMLVPGAMTAKLAAAVINVPAEPAPAPCGET